MVFSVELASPNFISRNDNNIEALILKSAIGDTKTILDNYLHPTSEESSHYLISENGEVYNLVPEKKASLNRGFASWRNINNFDLRAISITLTTNTAGVFSEVQIQALIDIALEKINTYNIPAYNVISACDASFLINDDFGFPWERMANSGIGLWPNDTNTNDTGDNLLELLTDIGYKINVPSYRMAIMAFQKHFVPDDVTGEETPKTIRIAKELQKIIRNLTNQ